MKKILKTYPLTLLCVVVVWYLSFFTPPPTRLDDVVGIDKLVHTAMYGGLCFLFWYEHFRSRFDLKKESEPVFLGIDWHRAIAWGVVAPAAMGGLIELLQENCTNHRRSGDWWDFGANTLGVVLMYLLIRLVLYKVVSAYPKRSCRWLFLFPGR